MCNLYRLHKGSDAIRQLFAGMGMQLGFPKACRTSRHGTSHHRSRRHRPPCPVRTASYDLLSGAGAGQVRGKPSTIFARTAGISGSGCLIVADGFYEFTASSDPKQKRKDRWLFIPADGGTLGIAGMTRTSRHWRGLHDADDRARRRRSALSPAADRVAATQSLGRMARPLDPQQRVAPAKRRRISDGGARLTATFSMYENGAGEGIRTLDPNLGKVVLYP